MPTGWSQGISNFTGQQIVFLTAASRLTQEPTLFPVQWYWAKKLTTQSGAEVALYLHFSLSLFNMLRQLYLLPHEEMAWRLQSSDRM
jgi:hypothetical protein